MPYRDFKSVAELSSYQALALSVFCKPKIPTFAK